MNLQDYIEEKKDLTINLLDFIDSEINSEEKFSILNNFIVDHDIKNNIYEFKSFLDLLSDISNYHKRSSNFYDKLEQILVHFQEIIKQVFTSFALYDIFRSNKRILLILIKKGIISLDESLLHFIEKDYNEYFCIEISKFHDKEIKDESLDLNEIEKNRESGENESYLAQLIQNDSVDEFIPFATRSNLNLSTEITCSIYETNSFLLEMKKATLIEYAAFFGSIQIFQYLRLNNVELTPSLWIYAIHGRNPELIHLLEENRLKPEDRTYKECLLFAIKCHHNEIAEYIQNNLMDTDEREINNVTLPLCLQYNNFLMLPNELNYNGFLYYYSCKYNYLKLVDILLQTDKIDVNAQIIHINSFLNEISEFMKLIQF